MRELKSFAAHIIFFAELGDGSILSFPDDTEVRQGCLALSGSLLILPHCSLASLSHLCYHRLVIYFPAPLCSPGATMTRIQSCLSDSQGPLLSGSD